ncbi:MAG: excinuclease ABC subunit UvrC [Clostridiales bacterium]|nr:excinuclease ABC subunit UvrC [Clostridiales bacterium]
METKLINLPDQPGVYIMKNKDDKIIYIGKAVSLRNRVRQYFRSTGHSGKVGAMVSNIEDFEYIITDTEVEALILESNLIKKHRPKYNILLKDDKHYPFIQVTTGEEYPRILLTRRIKKDKHRYFGPYTNAGAVRETIEVIKRIFPIRSCNRSIQEGQTPEKPCLHYYIGQCWGPCMGSVPKDKYQDMIKDVLRFLEGKEEDVLVKFRAAMLEASENLQFEKAAGLRDKIQAVEKIMETQKIMSTSMVDQDVFACYQEESQTAIQIFMIRNGKLIATEHPILEDTGGLDLSEVLNSYLKQFYADSVFIPKEIYLQEDIDDQEVIGNWLTEKKGSRVYIRRPQRGEKLKLVQMARRNAEEALHNYNRKAEREFARTKGAVLELQEALYLAASPKRIEAFDISNTQGTQSVASMVVFIDGKAAKKEYRRFKIKTVEGPNDFASIAEVVGRRFSRGIEERSKLEEEGKSYSLGKFSHLPDLVIIDGGKGQLSAAMTSMEELGVDHIPAFGLAEEFDELYSVEGGDPIFLPRNSSALHLLQRLRDEAHRFALSYHRSLRNKNSLHSVLQDIPGIGPKRMKSLIKAFGSVEGIQKASLDQLVQVKGMNHKVAKEIKDYLG